MEYEIGVVTDENVAALRGQLQPGATIPSANLYERYQEMAAAAGLPAAHRTALGHALRRADWKRKRVRKNVGGRVKEMACWVVPGKPLLSEEDAHVYDALSELGDGVFPNLLIFTRYQEVARRQGWRESLEFNALQRWLTRKGFVRLRDKGEPCRFVDEQRVAARR